MTTFRIGEAAELLGVSADTVRRWVDAGRVAATRDEHGHRVIDVVDLAGFARAQAGEPDGRTEESSARNRLRGIVTAVVKDTVMAQVDIQAGPFRVVSLMSREAVDALDLRVGSVAVAVIKSTTVVVERSAPAATSKARAGDVGSRVVRATLAGLTALVVAGLVGCGGGTASGSAPGTRAGAAAVTGTVTVFAAASLTGSFTRIGKDFEAANPGSTVKFNFAGSSALATQINQGAPADVFASAAPATMKTVTDAGNGLGTPTTFVKNQLVIAVPKGDPKGIRALSDLTRPGVKVALCAAQVPCGAAAKTALAAATVRITPVTLEQDVKAALAKVKLGEVDAALVYRTDVRAAASDVEGVEFPESSGAVNEYPIIVVKDAPNRAGAQAFVSWVLSDKGRAVLNAAGFQAP